MICMREHRPKTIFGRRREFKRLFKLFKEDFYKELSKKYGDNEGTRIISNNIAKQLTKYFEYVDNDDDFNVLWAIPEHSVAIRNSHIMNTYFKKKMKEYKKKYGFDGQIVAYYTLYEEMSKTIRDYVISLLNGDDTDGA